ncbi:hypothetical protein [Bradyrhizobium sp. ARR65]|uniref:hypothetical protein n=1 Tax=Bradyrhizobium sp. ARR65 TaxID=1040989 RepID=UPI0012F95C44|nr:hypothetical protein [Bradyrhizobium sp. ARR65]
MAIMLANVFSAAVAVPFIAAQALHSRLAGSAVNARSSSGKRADAEVLSDRHPGGVSQRQAILASASLTNQILDALDPIAGWLGPPRRRQGGKGRAVPDRRPLRRKLSRLANADICCVRTVTAVVFLLAFAGFGALLAVWDAEHRISLSRSRDSVNRPRSDVH